MATRKELILEFAKDLYTQYDGEGKKKYSFRAISAEIQQEFNKKVHYSTVAKWAKDPENNWDGINQKIKQHAIDKANGEGNFSPEEKVIDARSDDLADVYKYGKLMSQIGTDVLQRAYKSDVKGAPKAHSAISVKEAIAAMRTGSNIVFRLNDVPDPEAGGAGIIMMPDNGR